MLLGERECDRLNRGELFSEDAGEQRLRGEQVACASRKRLRAARRRLLRPENAFPREPRPTRDFFFPLLVDPCFFKKCPRVGHSDTYFVGCQILSCAYIHPGQTTIGPPYPETSARAAVSFQCTELRLF